MTDFSFRFLLAYRFRFTAAEGNHKFPVKPQKAKRQIGLSSSQACSRCSVGTLFTFD